MKTKIKNFLLTLFIGIAITFSSIAQTTNYIPKWNGSAYVNTTTPIFEDATNSRIGIATTAPSTILDVKNTTTGSVIRATVTEGAGSNSFGYGFYIDNTAREMAQIYASYVRSASGGDGALHFFTRLQGTLYDRMMIMENGNVGIGTTTPGAPLEVAGQVKITGGSPGAGKVLVSDANGLASWSTVGANGGWSTIGNSGTSTSTNFIGNTDNVALKFRINNVNAGTIGTSTTGVIFFGVGSGDNNSGNTANTGVGYQTLQSNTTGAYNTAIGLQALKISTGDDNTAIGAQALYNNTTGAYNTANGYVALTNNSSGVQNTASGAYSLGSTNTGSYNTAIGDHALLNNTTGSDNTALGYSAWGAGAAYSNSTALGANSSITASNQVRVGDANVTSIGGQVGWTTLSDGRFKKDIKENVPGLAFITKLRPVTYYLDMDGIASYLHTPDKSRLKDAEAIKAKMLQTGFIAQEVEKTASGLGYEFNGVDKPKNEEDYYGLRYAEFVVPLVKAVQEQQQMIDRLNTKADKQEAVNKSLQEQINKLIAKGSTNESINNNSSSSNISLELSDKNVVVLEQNIPNPFAEQTTINYFLPDNVQRAQIIFFDQSGKIIKSVDLTEKGKGTLNVFASDLSNGIYTYSLIVDGQTTETKKMIKTK
jgi:hypothetical protein